MGPYLVVEFNNKVVNVSINSKICHLSIEKVNFFKEDGEKDGKYELHQEYGEDSKIDGIIQTRPVLSTDYKLSEYEGLANYYWGLDFSQKIII